MVIKLVPLIASSKGLSHKGTCCIEKYMGGITLVASSEWSLNNSGRIDRFDCN